MSKRKTMDKAQARERRNRLLEAAAAAQLSLTEGVREMRAISGLTQEEFARHREVSARVIKALELGQGNPTVATLNRIGEFFGLEVAFVPLQRPTGTERKDEQASAAHSSRHTPLDAAVAMERINQEYRVKIDELFGRIDTILAALPKPGQHIPSKPAGATNKPSRSSKKQG